MLSLLLSLLLAISTTTTAVQIRPFDGGTIIASPAVAKANLLYLKEDLNQAVGSGAEWLHFGIHDGRMVPEVSIGSPIVAACRKAFPDVVLDVKLGVVSPEQRLDEFIEAGADIISVHPESTTSLASVIHQIGSRGVAPGVILNPGTPLSAVESVLMHCAIAIVLLVSMRWRVWYCLTRKQ